MATRDAPERNGTFLGYPFVPLPRRVRRAHGEGRLSDEGFALVGLLYDEADIGRLKRRLPTPTLTREQIAAGIGRARHIDSVLRLLRRLRDDPGQWFTYRVERRHYVFTLNPNEDDLSAILSASADPHLSEVATPPDPASALALDGAADTDLSEVADTPLSAHLSAPDTDLSANAGPATPHQHGDPGTPPERPVRVPQSYREHQPSHRRMGGDTRTREDDDLAGFLPDVRAAILRHRRNVAAAAEPSFIDLLKADLDADYPEDDTPGNTETHPSPTGANGSDLGSSVVGAGIAPRTRGTT